MISQRIGAMHLDTGVHEVHYLCVLSQEEWDDSESADEASELVRDSLEGRLQLDAEGSGFGLEVIVIEHPILVRGFIAIARLTQGEAAMH